MAVIKQNRKEKTQEPDCSAARSLESDHEQKMHNTVPQHPATN